MRGGSAAGFSRARRVPDNRQCNGSAGLSGEEYLLLCSLEGDYFECVFVRRVQKAARLSRSWIADFFFSLAEAVAPARSRDRRTCRAPRDEITEPGRDGREPTVTLETQVRSASGTRLRT
jgi:hypothetical protein